ncbi:hypothetical protein IW152_002053 [Coemansia sp. BCRC 34962]|nr:hypothetical protein IW152_002053 [Coemansia sp. BCRC 34962]
MDTLSCLPFDSCNFPQVNNITFYFHPSARGEGAMVDHVLAMANIRAFTQLVKAIAPKANSIEILPAKLTSPPETSCSYFGALISRLFGLVDRIELGIYCQTNLFVTLSLDGLYGLVYLRFAFEGDMSQSILLAQQNSSTLQSLILEFNRDINIGRLVKGADGFVAYPHLRDLRVCGHSSNSDNPRSVTGDMVLFPHLQKLVLKVPLPFADDTLFRGNADTLAYLDMVLDSPTVYMLLKHNVFTTTSHPNLQCVNVVQDDPRLPCPFATAVEFMQFILSIGPQAPVREIGGFSGCIELNMTLPLLQSHDCIQVLTLVNIPLDFWSLIAVIKSLPLLSDLYTYFYPPRFDTVAETAAHSELPAYVLSNYAPMSEHFRCWHLMHYTTHQHTDAIKCALLLALVCPNFDYLATDFGESRLFMKNMEGIIASDMFKEYAPRLRRLLFNR